MFWRTIGPRLECRDEPLKVRATASSAGSYACGECGSQSASAKQKPNLSGYGRIEVHVLENETVVEESNQELTETEVVPPPDENRVRTKKVDANDVAAGLGLKALVETAEELLARSEIVFRSKRKSFGDLRREYSGLRAPVVDGILRRGEVMNVVASPKVGKSWCSLGLAMAIITGTKWFDKFQCTQGKVLIIDNELHEETITHRVSVVAKAMGLPESEIEEQIDFVSLRGGLVSLRELRRHVEDVSSGYYQLVVLDALYKFFPPKTDENDNGAMADMYNWLDYYASYFDAAVAIIHHTSKGIQSGKSVTDVGSGGGAQARAADTHLIMRPHENETACVVDAATRSFKPVQPFCVKFQYPLWTPADDLNPEDLKSAHTHQGKPKESPEEKAARFQHEADDIFATLPAAPATFKLLEIEKLSLTKGYVWNQRIVRMNRDEWISSGKIVEVVKQSGPAPAIYKKA